MGYIRSLFNPLFGFVILLSPALVLAAPKYFDIKKVKFKIKMGYLRSLFHSLFGFKILFPPSLVWMDKAMFT